MAEQLRTEEFDEGWESSKREANVVMAHCRKSHFCIWHWRIYWRYEVTTYYMKVKSQEILALADVNVKLKIALNCPLK